MKWKTYRILSDDDEVRKRKELIFSSNVLELNRLVERIHQVKPYDQTIPWFDPSGGGVNAKILILQQDPSKTAAEKTQFISPDNPDETADNTTWLRDRAGLKPSELVHWNIVPWWIGEKNVKTEIAKAKPYLQELLELLVNLEVAVCMGNPARDGWNFAFPDNPTQDGWKKLSISRHARPVVLSSPHPSWRNIRGANKDNNIVNGLNPESRILATLLNAHMIVR